MSVTEIKIKLHLCDIHNLAIIKALCKRSPIYSVLRTAAELL